MSQSKEMAWESPPHGDPREDATEPSQRDLLTLRLHALLEQRARLVDELEQVDREIDRVRAEARDQACRDAERLLGSPDDRSCVIGLLDFVRGVTEPPADADRNDFERCLGKVVLALRRRGDSLSRAQVQVRYQARTGRVVAIALQADDGPERQLYRRFDLGPTLPG
jgi:hypothetical protein